MYCYSTSTYHLTKQGFYTNNNNFIMNPSSLQSKINIIIIANYKTMVSLQFTKKQHELNKPYTTVTTRKLLQLIAV